MVRHLPDTTTELSTPSTILYNALHPPPPAPAAARPVSAPTLPPLPHPPSAPPSVGSPITILATAGTPLNRLLPFQRKAASVDDSAGSSTAFRAVVQLHRSSGRHLARLPWPIESRTRTMEASAVDTRRITARRETRLAVATVGTRGGCETPPSTLMDALPLPTTLLFPSTPASSIARPPPAVRVRSAVSGSCSKARGSVVDCSSAVRG